MMFCSCIISFAAAEAGAVAYQAEHKKCVKYAHLDHHHIFTPIAIETSGVYGSETLKFLKELGHRLKQASGECNAYSYLLQRLSVAVQRGNAASVSYGFCGPACSGRLFSVTFY